MIVPPNRKRRIFNPSPSAAPVVRMVLAVLAGLAILAGGLWLVGLYHTGTSRAPAAADIVAEPHTAAVADGETLRLGDRVVRLADIAAPKRGGDCRVSGTDCGTAAANALAALIADHQMICTPRGQDASGRLVAVCRAGDVDLNAAMVRQGWAHATAAPLRQLEAEARDEGRGLWRQGDW